MKSVRFYYTLDVTFKEGVDYRKIKQERSAGNNIDNHYSPLATAIYLCWSFAGQYFKISIGHSIKPVEWDFTLKLPCRKHKHYLELSTLLNHIKSMCEKEYLNLKSNGIPVTADTIKQLAKRAARQTPSNTNFLWCAYEEFLSEKRQLTKPATIVKYNSTKSTLEKFEKRMYALDLGNLATMKFYRDFKIFSSQGLALLNNSISKHIQNIKAFLQWGFDHNKHYVTSTEFKRFKCEGDFTQPIFLTPDELNALEEHVVESNSTLQLSKDIFLFLCYTGQRISDALALKQNHIKVIKEGHMEWELYQEKGNKSRAVYIPIVSKARNILEKYMAGDSVNRFVFPRFSPVVVNRNLKKIGEAARLDTLTTKVNFSGVTKREICLPKFKLLTTHVGRKTFITLLSQNKLSDTDVRSISGHSSYKEMLPYLGVDRNSIKKEMEQIFG